MSILMETVLKAFLKSRQTLYTALLSSNKRAMSPQNIITLANMTTHCWTYSWWLYCAWKCFLELVALLPSSGPFWRSEKCCPPVFRQVSRSTTIIQRLRVASQCHQLALSALWVHPSSGMSRLHKGSLTDPLPPGIDLPCSRLPWSPEPGIPEGWSCEDWGKEGIQHPSTFHVLCHQGPCPIQQQVSIFPNLPSVSCVQALLVVFDNPHQIQFHLGFDFPNSVSACSDSFSIPPGLPDPSSTFCILLFICKFCQEHLVYPHKSPGIFTWPSICQNRPSLSELLNLDETILEYKPGFLSSSPLQGLFW